MPAWFWILLWWLAFAASHLILSSLPVRRVLIARLGAGGFAGMYSVVALLTFVPIVWVYWYNRHSGPLLWSLAGVPGMHSVALAVGALGFAFIAGSLAQPSASSIDPRAVPRAHGLTRITRHPLFTGLTLWGFAHVLVNGFLGDVVFFGGFALFSAVGAAHQDSRLQVEHAERLGSFYDETSLIPFGAVITRRTRIVPGEMPWGAVGAGIAAAIVIYLLHSVLFY